MSGGDTMQQKKILIVAESRNKLKSIQEFLQGKCLLDICENCIDAYRICRKSPCEYDLLITYCDYPFNILPLIRAIRNDISFIHPYILAVTDDRLKTTTIALKAGADSVVEKETVQDFLRSALEKEKKSTDLRTFTEFAMKIIEYKNFPTYEHSKNVKIISSILANLYFLENKKIDFQFHDNLRIAALFHDIGKILVPESILCKPSSLTYDEFNTMKSHTRRGAELFSTISKIYPEDELLSACMKVCLYHHEKFDGSGYPHGLKGEQIPLEARIVAIADVFDALTSVRYYRSAYSLEKALRVMEEEKAHYDPYIFHLFMDNIEFFCNLKLDSSHSESPL
jgi:putative two-component system response regulator